MKPMSSYQRPTQQQLDESVARVRERLLARTSHKQRIFTVRRALFGAGAVGLFAVGVAVGGATLATPRAPASAFTLSCYSSPDAAQPSATLGYDVVPAAQKMSADGGRADLLSQCSAMLVRVDEGNIYSYAIKALTDRGVTCGAIEIAGGHTWYFEPAQSADSTPAWTITDVPPTTPLAGNCVIEHKAAPLTDTSSLAICSDGPTRVNVYALKDQEASTVCSSKGMSLWDE